MAEYFGGVHGSYPGVEGLPAKCLPVGKFPLDLIRLVRLWCWGAYCSDPPLGSFVDSGAAGPLSGSLQEACLGKVYDPQEWQEALDEEDGYS